MTHTEDRSVHIPLAHAPYDVRVGAGLLTSLGECVSLCTPEASRVFLLVDEQLPRVHVDLACAALHRAGFELTIGHAHASEPAKSLQTFERLVGEVAQAKLSRDDPVVAMGGGIVGDVGGFVAASYRRGVPVIQCPTTLLSMVDASVGGKTGVNIRTATGLKKNMVGAFWQPRAVLADVSTLQTLGDREFRAGLAECVKHALICRSLGSQDVGLFDWLEANAAQLLARDEALLCELVERNVRIKACAVVADEREQAPSSDGGRALLNLGHTFGHAIEPIESLSPTNAKADSPLQHGEAVALGTVCACAASVLLGMLDQAQLDRVRALLTALGLPVCVCGLPETGRLAEVMGHDKKVRSGKLRLVLPDASAAEGQLGASRVVESPDTSVIAAGFDSIRS